MKVRKLAVAISAATAALTGGILATSQQANAADAPFTVDLPAGVACNGFALRVQSSGNDRNVKTFVDANGNPVRQITTGKGSDLTFTNLDSGETYKLKANGSNEKTVFNPDGSRTVVDTGHNVIILFPTDHPAGPSTKLYVGRVEYRVDPGEVFTLITESGRTVDICAQLA